MIDLRILLIEDEEHLSEALEFIFKNNNYTIDICKNGLDGLDFALLGIYDCVILDVMLPGMDGFEVLSNIRLNKVDTPVIMLSALSDIDNKLNGLDNGADDYLPKPFETRELLSRVNALIRRHTNNITDMLEYGDIKYNRDKLVVISKNMDTTLSLKEGLLMELLITNKNVILSKDFIITKLWGYDSEATDNNVEVYISYLRNKLSLLDTTVSIKTIRGKGYIICGG